MLIKIADINDAIFITEILESAFQEFKEKYTLQAFNATVISPEEVVERMKNGIVWIAKLKDKPIGTVSGKIINQTFYIQGMAVLPNSRGKRVGFSLLKTIEEYSKANNCAELLLSTTPYLTKAIKLYKDFGFKIINEAPYEFYGTPLFNMKKEL